MDSAYKLAIEIAADDRNFNRTIDRAGSNVDQMVDKAKEATGQNSKLAGSFNSISANVGKFLGIAGGAAAILGFFKGSIQAVEGPGDKFEAAISGAKTAVFELQRAVATADFSNFITNLKEGYARGKDLAEMMDDLADRSAYADYVIAGKKAQSAELQETIKNKTLDISVRRKYAEDRNQIEREIMERTQTLSEKRFIIEKENWERTNKMSTEQAIKLYEFVDSLTTEQAKKMSDSFIKVEKAMGWKNKKGVINSVMFETGYTRASIEAYKQYLDLMRTGEADVLPKLFTAYKNVDQVRFESQRTYNLAVRETSMLLEMEESKLKTVIKRVKELSAGQVNTNIPIPTLGTLPKGALAPGPTIEAMVVPLQKVVNYMKEGSNGTQMFLSGVNALGEAFGSLVAGSTSGLKGLVSMILQTTRTIINAFLAEAIAATIAKNAKTPWGLIGAAVGVAALEAFWNQKVPKMANGALAYGPTIAQVGEYPGARQDPEVISPLSKLKDIIGGQAVMPQKVRLNVEVGGSMSAYFEYQQRYRNNFD